MPARAPLDDFPERIGVYVPLRLLGRGGMASVYLCEAPDGARVAVKWLARATPGQLRSHQREVEAMQRVRHAHVVRVLDRGVAEGRPFLVMEHVQGQDLRLYAQKLRDRPASERYAETLRVGMELCEALEAVHAMGLVHRDVKPSNVLLDGAGRALLADFGVVRDIDEVEAVTSGVMVGTAAWAAPEQLRGEAVDHRADLYSLGCTLYHLLTAKKPYPGPEREDYVRGHCQAPIPHPSAVDPQVPPGLEAVVMRLMAKAPADRPPTARATRLALQAGRPVAHLPPLAGRRRYVDAVNEVLDRVASGQARILRVVGPSGSGRRWLLEVVQDLAGRRALPLVVAHDSATLGATLKRLRRGELLLLATRLPVPRTAAVPVEELELEPLGLAELRRSVVSAGPRTHAPHLVAERLHRATGGHPAWLLPLLQGHLVDEAIALPEVLEPPEVLLRRVEALSEEARQALAALAVWEVSASTRLVEQLTRAPAEAPLAELVAAGLVVQHGDEHSLMGELVGQAAQPPPPEAAALHRRAAAALERTGHPGRAREHRAAAGPCATTCDALPLALEEAERLALRGALVKARDQVERTLVKARAARDRDTELKALRVLGEVLMDQGQVRLAESRLADAVALARAMDRPGERRYAHVLRAAATLENRPGSRTAAAAALDRLHRALTKVHVAQPDPSKALALAVHAHAAAVLGDRRAFENDCIAAWAEAEPLEPRLRLRVALRLARALLTAGVRDEARARALTLADEAEAQALPALAWMARAVAARACGEPPPDPALPEASDEDRARLRALQL